MMPSLASSRGVRYVSAATPKCWRERPAASVRSSAVIRTPVALKQGWQTENTNGPPAASQRRAADSSGARSAKSIRAIEQTTASNGPAASTSRRATASVASSVR